MSTWHEASADLPFRLPLCPDNLYGHLVATAVPGVEEWRDGAYRRTLRLPGGPAIVSLAPRPDHVAARLLLADDADEPAALAVCRRVLDLDADPAAVDSTLSADPVLAPLVAACPGRRIPGAPDAAELAVRAVVGQQVSTAAARTHAARLVVVHGTPLTDPEGGLSHLFPTPEQLAGLDPETLAMPRTRRATLIGLAHALAAGEVDLTDLAAARAGLLALPGIGPWTVETVAMRALGDTDAFLPTDLGVKVLAAELGLPATPGALTRHAEAWRPYRGYAVQYLWAAGDHAVNVYPQNSS